MNSWLSSRKERVKLCIILCVIWSHSDGCAAFRDTVCCVQGRPVKCPASSSLKTNSAPRVNHDVWKQAAPEHISARITTTSSGGLRGLFFLWIIQSSYVTTAWWAKRAGHGTRNPVFDEKKSKAIWFTESDTLISHTVICLIWHLWLQTRSRFLTQSCNIGTCLWLSASHFSSFMFVSVLLWNQSCCTIICL